MVSGDSLLRVGVKSSRRVAGNGGSMRSRRRNRSRMSSRPGQLLVATGALLEAGILGGDLLLQLLEVRGRRGLLLDLVGQQLGHPEQHVDLLLLQLDLLLEAIDLRPRSALGLSLGLAEVLELLLDPLQLRLPPRIAARGFRRVGSVSAGGSGRPAACPLASPTQDQQPIIRKTGMTALRIGKVRTPSLRAHEAGVT